MGCYERPDHAEVVPEPEFLALPDQPHYPVPAVHAFKPTNEGPPLPDSPHLDKQFKRAEIVEMRKYHDKLCTSPHKTTYDALACLLGKVLGERNHAFDQWEIAKRDADRRHSDYEEAKKLALRVKRSLDAIVEPIVTGDASGRT